MINIYYKAVKNKILNGTLFYCFEYFEYLSRSCDVNLHIQTYLESDIDIIKDVFKNKYNFDNNLLKNIKFLSRATDIFKLKSDKDLFLDRRSFKTFYMFSNAKKIFVYKNEEFINPISKKDITYFGFYDYQAGFNVKENLKFNFDIYKSIDEDKITDYAYVSSPGINYNKILSKLNITENNILLKDDMKPQNNLFESFDTLYYYHCGHLDTNNRLIVEAYFYNKNIVLIDDDMKVDSVYLRYIDMIKNGAKKYKLNYKDKLIKALLE